jgi:Flp pilus assembly protein TadB
MAQPKNKRRRKRRGTQGGRIDTRARANRPRSREEAKARARANRSSGAKGQKGQKQDLPPTWRNSALRGLAAAAIFVIILLVLFKRPIGVALAFGAFMLAFYIPTGYYIDMTLWRRRERARIRARSE